LELPITDVFVQQGKDLLQLTNLHCDDTFTGFLSASRSRAFFLASADPLGTNPHRHCQLFSVNSLGGGMRQITHFDLGYRLSYPGCFCPCGIGYGAYRLIVQDPVTKAIVFNTAQDPFHLSAIRLRPGLFSYDQILAMRPDGSGLRQLTDAAGFTTNPDGSIRVELPGPFAYSAGLP